MTRSAATKSGGDLYIKSTEVTLVSVPIQKLVKTDTTTTWKYYSF